MWTRPTAIRRTEFGTISPRDKDDEGSLFEKNRGYDRIRQKGIQVVGS
jgi:hypothetical protein